jgi:hypothetical protein
VHQIHRLDIPLLLLILFVQPDESSRETRRKHYFGKPYQPHRQFDGELFAFITSTNNIPVILITFESNLLGSGAGASKPGVALLKSSNGIPSHAFTSVAAQRALALVGAGDASYTGFPGLSFIYLPR